MKLKLILTMVCALLLGGIYAQNATTSPTNIATTKENIGSLIAQLADNISEEAFTPAFLKNKKGWMEKARMTSDTRGAVWLLKSLQEGLKGTAFTPHWTEMQQPQNTDLKTAWLANLDTVKTPADAAEKLIVLWGNINPAMMGANWANVKSAWTQATMNFN